jgi:hypothetical protein
VKVLFLVLDGVSPRHVDGGTMPTLAGLALEGGWCRDGAIGVMPSSTYPNHATFVTGVPPQDHGIVANELPSAEAVIPSWELGPAVPTLFDAMHAVGRRSAAVFGDHHLVGVTGADRATVVWSADGHAGAARDVLGYAKDRETAAATVQAVDGGAELVIAQFNEPDTIAHIFGPDSPEALDRYGRTDGHVGDVVESLRGQWGTWAIVVVSDHSQETVTDPLPIDLHSVAAELDIAGRIVDDGAAAIVAGEMADDPSWMVRVPGVEGAERLGRRAVLAWAVLGRYFAAGEIPVRGVHGSPRTAVQVAVVAGGHPGAESLAAQMVGQPLHSTSWAPAMADLLSIPFPPG